MEPFLGEIKLLSFNFAPKGWAMCNGAFLAINQNQALFALLGTMYGGNGQVTFGLPDLRGRSPVGIGQGPGLSTSITQGELAGVESVTLTSSQMPMHTHVLQAAGTATGAVTTPSATNNVLGASPPAGPPSASIWSTALTTPVPLNVQQCGTTGGSQPLGLRNPYLGVNFVVALEGIFPSRP
jgi:microcystin-dependent protein